MGRKVGLLGLLIILLALPAFAAQRTDRLDLTNGSTGVGKLVFYEDTDDGTNKTTIQPVAMAGDITYSLPPDDGDNGEILTTNGSGVLTWEAAGAGSGDLTAWGDCSTGACGSGVAGGGTTFALYDGDSNKGSFVTANLNADRTYTFGNLSLTFDQSVAVGAGPSFTNAVLTTPNIGSATGSISGNAGTATALAANGSNCSSGSYPLGVDASGASESCTTAASTATDFLVGTSEGTLSGEIVVGTSPGGELGGTWASPTLDDSVTVTGWVMGASTATTPSADDNDTSLATTAFVQTEFAYREFDLMPAGMILDDTAPPDLTIVESTGTGTARRLVADFDPATDQFGYWTFVAPSDTTSGNILLDVIWFTNDTGANEDAIWYSQISCTTEGDTDSMAEDAAGSANTASENCNATEANRLISTTITLSNTDSIAAGDVCTLVLGRDADDSIGDADNDGLSSDARLVAVHVKIPRI